MAPRKKARFLAPPVEAKGAQLAGSIVSDSAVAHSIASVPPLQRSVCQCVELIYQLRHGVTIDIDKIDKVMADVSDTLSETQSASGAASLSRCSSAMPVVDEFGIYPFPVNQGGTFIQIAQRAQRDRQWLLSESAALLHAAGLLKGDDVTELEEEFLSTDTLFETICKRFQSVLGLFQVSFVQC